MKAYMSTQHTDGSGPNGPCEPCFRRNLFGGLAEPTGPQRAADSEARRILADVELARPGQFAYGYGGGPAERAALAESLAAFVAE